MTDSELRNYYRSLFSQVELIDKQYQNILCELSSICGELEHTRLKRKRQFDQLVELTWQLSLSRSKNASLKKDLFSILLGTALSLSVPMKNCSIDNLAVERAIRPLTIQRKNSLFFGSLKYDLNSAIL